MEINRTKRLNNLQLYPVVNKKTMIFLHHTAGTSADGAISWWNQTPEKVGTAYVIERDGTIYECFDPKSWAYHSGVKGDDDYIDKNSINLEIVAAGQLYLEGSKYMFYPLFPNKAAGKEIPKEDVWDMGEEGWRGFRYYHKYTDKQIQSVIDLTNQLMKDFNISLQPNWGSSKFFEYNEQIFKEHLSGIWSHTSVRKDKNDIIPFKDFLKKIYEGIKGSSKTLETKIENKVENQSSKPKSNNK